MSRTTKNQTAHIKFTPPDLEKRIQKHWKYLKEPLGNAMKSGMRGTARQAANEMQGHRYQGVGIDSVLGNGSHTLTRMYGSTGFMVGSRSISVNIMEWGRGSGKRIANIDSIREWMQSKGMNPSDNDVKNVAVSIGMRGVKATKPVLKAKKKMLPRVKGMVNRALEKFLDGVGLK